MKESASHHDHNKTTLNPSWHFPACWGCETPPVFSVSWMGFEGCFFPVIFWFSKILKIKIFSLPKIIFNQFESISDLPGVFWVCFHHFQKMTLKWTRKAVVCQGLPSSWRKSHGHYRIPHGFKPLILKSCCFCTFISGENLRLKTKKTDTGGPPGFCPKSPLG